MSPRWLALCLLCGLSSPAWASPSILLTNVPAFGSQDDLSGLVVDAAPASYAVAVFIYVPNAGWWSKPYCDPQLTPIRPDGSWTADITTGGADAQATKITALLVSTNYSQPCVLGLASLPTDVTAQAIASATVERFDPSLRWVQFSGYDWWVKTSPDPLGPGPNYFSDSTSNVWVDAQGQLHLRITHRTNQWQCAEIVTRRTFGYGSYRFELSSPVTDLDPNVTLGLFTWSDDPAYAHREIDVECGVWDNTNDPNNAQFVVQPWDWPNHLVRYAVPPALADSTHLFAWATNRISFQCQRGSYSPNPASTNLLSAWEFTDAPNVPQSGDENVRINLWLVNGTPPANGQEVEFIIKSFEFTPPGPALPASLSGARLLEGQPCFDFTTRPDRRYQVLLSTNLSVWQPLAEVLATNTAVSFTDTTAHAGSARFYRVLTLP